MIAALKILADVCFYFMFVSAFKVFRYDVLPLAVMAGLVFIAVFIAAEKPYSVVGKAGLLLPLLSFGLVSSFGQAALLVPVIVYMAVMVLNNAMKIPYYSQRDIFLCQIAICLIFCFTWITYTSANNVAVILPLIFAGLFLLIGEYVLLSIRGGKGLDLKGKVVNLGMVIAVAVTASLAMGGFYFVLKHSENLFELIMMPFVFILHGIIYIIVFFCQFIPKPTDVAPSEEPISQTVEEIYEFILEPENTEIPYENLAITPAMAMVLKIIALIITCLLIGFVVYKLSFLFKNQKIDEKEYSESNEIERFGFGKRKKKEPVLSNSQKVRKIYREYLYYLRSKGIEISQYLTSLDVLNLSDDQDLDARLREIYLKARYHQEYKVTDEDVENARKYLDLIRGAEQT